MNANEATAITKEYEKLAIEARKLKRENQALVKKIEARFYQCVACERTWKEVEVAKEATEKYAWFHNKGEMEVLTCPGCGLHRFVITVVKD